MKIIESFNVLGLKAYSVR